MNAGKKRKFDEVAVDSDSRFLLSFKPDFWHPKVCLLLLPLLLSLPGLQDKFLLSCFPIDCLT